MQPAPEGGVADVGDPPRGADLLGQLGEAPA
jgi:hypothetical protein